MSDTPPDGFQSPQDAATMLVGIVAKQFDEITPQLRSLAESFKEWMETLRPLFDACIYDATYSRHRKPRKSWKGKHTQRARRG